MKPELESMVGDNEASQFIVAAEQYATVHKYVEHVQQFPLSSRTWSAGSALIWYVDTTAVSR
ncbi:hypothetical protein FHX15_003231 [Rhizobium sp. BK650]|uniref:hypothetical protein n=1 Tax=Rhizobium sp. BK650 TaxID=2586990 RepID=UPI00183C27EA|nr:hypothetical protein [Rhizobium sp. BK650]MBB3657989.1 hypothetical protein [Rhizobium sp. BK650]